MFYPRYSLSIILLMAACPAYAQSTGPRGEMIDSYISYRKSGTSIYQPPPITHMVPNFNTITYALAYEKRDVTILPRLANGDLDTSNKSSLTMKGYTIDPHLAISLKKVGIGFSIENSKNTSTTQIRSPYNSSSDTEQRTTVAASGLGFNVSALPFESLRKENKLALILGGKSLNVKHDFTENLPQGSQEDPSTVRYNLLRYELGANLTLSLLKHISVIPWLDYSHTDIKAAQTAPGTGNNSNSVYNDDLRLYWQAYPDLRYGIDLSIHVWGLDIRIGSFLGSMARLNAQPDYIQDKGFSVSLSFDQKGG